MILFCTSCVLSTKNSSLKWIQMVFQNPLPKQMTQAELDTSQPAGPLLPPRGCRGKCRAGQSSAATSAELADYLGRPRACATYDGVAVFINPQSYCFLTDNPRLRLIKDSENVGSIISLAWEQRRKSVNSTWILR